MAFTYLDAAGPTAAPAVVIHADQELPKVWRVLSTWELDGARGAWIEHAEDTYNKRREVAQVVYGDAPILRPGNLGSATSGAVDRLRCASLVAHKGYGVRDNHPDMLARVAYYAERDQDITRLDWHARRLYEANGEPGPDDHFDGHVTPPIDAVPDPEPTDSETIVKAVALGVALHEVSLHPDSEWPAGWEKVTHDPTDWAYHAPATWVPIKWDTAGPLRAMRGVGAALTGWRHRQQERIYNAEQAAAGTPVAARPRRTGPSPDPTVAAEAAWIGRQLAALIEDDRVHQRNGLGSRWKGEGEELINRRRAWAWYRWGITPDGEWPRDKAGGFGFMAAPLPGALELHLEGLNRLAHEELDA